ncbi:hypothetical protein [Paraburkholderia tropica]|uniref:hypothetical protein n=1 Tax=Paraburkholderia tropica TaxID=92647 RepID=UPI000F54DBDE|nr:hypothetical protein [Paraburkholderia tropica]RQN39274.1 hypothetical protein EHZ25_08405 [Paraburkholderia tropica]
MISQIGIACVVADGKRDPILWIPYENLILPMKPCFQTVRRGAFTVLATICLNGCGDGGGGSTAVASSASTQAASPVAHASPDVRAGNEVRGTATASANDTNTESRNATNSSNTTTEHNYGRVTADDGVHTEP